MLKMTKTLTCTPVRPSCSLLVLWQLYNSRNFPLHQACYTVEKGERKKEQMTERLKTEFLCGTMFVLLDHSDGDWLLHLVKQQKRLRNDWLCNSDYLNQDVLASEATMQRARRSWLCCSGSRVFPASPSVVHPLLISENTKTIEQMEEEHCPCIWLNALKGHF